MCCLFSRCSAYRSLPLARALSAVGVLLCLHDSVTVSEPVSGTQAVLLLNLQSAEDADMFRLERAAREADLKYVNTAAQNESLRSQNKALSDLISTMGETAAQKDIELQQCKKEMHVALTHQAELQRLRPRVSDLNEKLESVMAISVAMKAEVSEHAEDLR